MGAVIIAARYVPRPPEDNIWNARPRGITTLTMPVGGGFPFVPRRWRFDHQDLNPGWLVESFPVPPVQKLAVVAAPFVPSRWKSDYNDAPNWYCPASSAFPLLSQTLQLYAPAPQRSIAVLEFEGWSGNKRQVNNLLLNAVVAPPVVPSRWKLDYNDGPVWSGSPTNIPDSFMPVGGGYPFKADWKGRFQFDDAANWQNKSVPVPPVQKLVGGNFPFVPRRWKLDYDDPGVWSGGPRNVNRVIDLAFVPPLVPTRWKLDYDDAAVWYTKPGAVPDNYLPVGGGFPFVPVRWRFNYDDASLWTVESFPVPKVQALANGGIPIKPPYWKYNNDDPGVWSGGPTNVSIVQALVIANPLLPSRWKFDYDDATVWSHPVPINGYSVNQPTPAPNPVLVDTHDPYILSEAEWRRLRKKLRKKYPEFVDYDLERSQSLRSMIESLVRPSPPPVADLVPAKAPKVSAKPVLVKPAQVKLPDNLIYEWAAAERARQEAEDWQDEEDVINLFLKTLN